MDVVTSRAAAQLYGEYVGKGGTGSSSDIDENGQWTATATYSKSSNFPQAGTYTFMAFLQSNGSPVLTVSVVSVN
jgi:hypothetical protein